MGGTVADNEDVLFSVTQSPDDIEIKYTVNGQEQKQEFPKGSAGGFSSPKLNAQVQLNLPTRRAQQRLTCEWRGQR